MMSALPYVSVAFVVGIIVASILWKREVSKKIELPKKTDRRKFPLKKVDGVLSDFERGIYRTLQHEVGANFFLFPKVPLAQIVTLSRKSKREEFYHNLLKTRHVDMLVCDRAKFAPFMAIQIIANAEQNDDEELTAHLVKSAEIPCVQLPLKKSFDPADLMTRVRSAIKERQKSAPLEFEEVKRQVH